MQIEPGAPVIAAATSLDGRIIALQRSAASIEFVARDSPNIFLQGSWRGKSAVIGFFWASAAECDLVMVTRSGLELYSLAADRQVLAFSHGW
jgi:hypothetical protein